MSAYSAAEKNAFDSGYRIGFKMGKAKEKYVLELESQREELLKACQALVDFDWGNCGDSIDRIIAMAQLAINKSTKMYGVQPGMVTQWKLDHPGETF